MSFINRKTIQTVLSAFPNSSSALIGHIVVKRVVRFSSVRNPIFKTHCYVRRCACRQSDSTHQILDWYVFTRKAFSLLKTKSSPIASAFTVFIYDYCTEASPHIGQSLAHQVVLLVTTVDLEVNVMWVGIMSVLSFQILF